MFEEQYVRFWFFVIYFVQFLLLSSEARRWLTALGNVVTEDENPTPDRPQRQNKPATGRFGRISRSNTTEPGWKAEQAAHRDGVACHIQSPNVSRTPPMDATNELCVNERQKRKEYSVYTTTDEIEGVRRR
jgi:hypothetical protein